MNLTLDQLAIIKNARQLVWPREAGLTIEELSEFTGISVRSIQRLHSHGGGPPRSRESYWKLYRVSKVIEWMETTAASEMARLNMWCGKNILTQTANEITAQTSHGVDKIAEGQSPS